MVRVIWGSREVFDGLELFMVFFVSDGDSDDIGFFFFLKFEVLGL